MSRSIPIVPAVAPSNQGGEVLLTGHEGAGAINEWAMAVIVPARNEAEHIRDCLRSILAAAEHCSPASSCYIVLVADSCNDGTVAIARELLNQHGVVISCQVGSVGRARQIGTLAALRHFEGRATSKIWLANTDGDTEVPVNWLRRQMEFAASGYHGVAGIVEIGELKHNGHDVAASLMADYLVQPDGTHAHIHGANLGFRADAYLRAGGWSNATLAEDHCLWRRLRQCELRLASSGGLRVKTSGRLQGRAAGGFAATLRDKLARMMPEPATAMPDP